MAIRIVPGVAVPRPGNQPAPRLVPPHRRLPSRAASGHGGPMDSKDFPYLVAPEPADSRLTTRVRGLDHDGRAVALPVVNARPLTTTGRAHVRTPATTPHPACPPLPAHKHTTPPPPP